MIQEIAPHVFYNAFKALDPEPGDYVLHYAANASWTGADSMRVHGKGMLAQERDGELVLPKLADYARKPSCVYLFSIDDKRFFLATDVLVEVKGSFRYLSVSGCRFYEPRWLAFAAITGYQLWDWRQHNRYCGACAAPAGAYLSARTFFEKIRHKPKAIMKAPSMEKNSGVPVSSAITPPRAVPTGMARPFMAVNRPMTRPSFSSGMPFCSSVIKGALNQAQATASTPMQPVNSQ